MWIAEAQRLENGAMTGLQGREHDKGQEARQHVADAAAAAAAVGAGYGGGGGVGAVADDGSAAAADGGRNDYVILWLQMRSHRHVVQGMKRNDAGPRPQR